MVVGSLNRDVSITLANSPYTVSAGISKVNVNTAGGNVRVNLPNVQYRIDVVKTSGDSYLVTLYVGGTQIGEIRGERTLIAVEDGQIVKDELYYSYNYQIGNKGGTYVVVDRYGRTTDRGSSAATLLQALIDTDAFGSDLSIKLNGIVYLTAPVSIPLIAGDNSKISIDFDTLYLTGAGSAAPSGDCITIGTIGSTSRNWVGRLRGKYLCMKGSAYAAVQLDNVVGGTIDVQYLYNYGTYDVASKAISLEAGASSPNCSHNTIRFNVITQFGNGIYLKSDTGGGVIHNIINGGDILNPVNGVYVDQSAGGTCPRNVFNNIAVDLFGGRGVYGFYNGAAYGNSYNNCHTWDENYSAGFIASFQGASSYYSNFIPVLNGCFGAKALGVWTIFGGSVACIAPGEKRIATGALTAGNANAIAFAWHNPTLEDIYIQRVIIAITTPGGTPSSLLDVGIADDATGTNRGTEFFDGIDLNTAAVNDSMATPTIGKQTVWVFCQDSASATDGWIVGQILDQNAPSLAGSYYIEYIGK